MRANFKLYVGGANNKSGKTENTPKDFLRTVKSKEADRREVIWSIEP